MPTICSDFRLNFRLMRESQTMFRLCASSFRLFEMFRTMFRLYFRFPILFLIISSIADYFSDYVHHISDYFEICLIICSTRIFSFRLDFRFHCRLQTMFLLVFVLLYYFPVVSGSFFANHIFRAQIPLVPSTKDNAMAPSIAPTREGPREGTKKSRRQRQRQAEPSHNGGSKGRSGG